MREDRKAERIYVNHKRDELVIHIIEIEAVTQRCLIAAFFEQFWNNLRGA